MSVFIIYEEKGNVLCGELLSEKEGPIEIKVANSSKPYKLKSAAVLLRCQSNVGTSAHQFIDQAHRLAAEVDIDFLWSALNELDFSAARFPNGFSFVDAAQDYYGNECDALQKVSTLIALMSSPIHFTRKGSGRFLCVLAQTLELAKNAIARRQAEEQMIEHWVAQLVVLKPPVEFVAHALPLLNDADKKSNVWRAAQRASEQLALRLPECLIRWGVVNDALDLHQQRFTQRYFGKAFDFAPFAVKPNAFDDLPLSSAVAFSLDDVTTTEIDDAFSVTWQSDTQARVGVHIAAPSLSIQPNDATDLIARARASTVYAPGEKLTMLPPSLIALHSLDAGTIKPVLSLYFEVTLTEGQFHYQVLASRLERILIAQNLRTNECDAIYTEAALQAPPDETQAFAREIQWLWRWAKQLWQGRQDQRAKSGLNPESNSRVDYQFYVEAAQVRIEPRQRGAPLDLLVSELMIHTNQTWAQWLAQLHMGAIYRGQQNFKVRQLTRPLAHEGLGVVAYMWSTSPLRRYTDLVNQWQLLAAVAHGPAAALVAPFRSNDSDLYVIINQFEERYQIYANYQRQMEDFWCLRWLKQQAVTQIHVRVLNDNLVQFSELPFRMKLPLLQAARGAELELNVGTIDEIDIRIDVSLAKVLPIDSNQTI